MILSVQGTLTLYELEKEEFLLEQVKQKGVPVAIAILATGTDDKYPGECRP